MKSLKERLPLVLSATALVVSLASAGAPAIAHGVQHALFAHDSDKVDGLHASKKPGAGKLLALDSKKRLPAGLSSINSLNGANCSWGPKKGKVIDVSTPYSVTGNGGTNTPTFQCFVEDQWEQNDSKVTASNLTGAGSLHYASIYPAGDNDWFVAARSLRYIYVVLNSGTLAQAAADIHIYKNGVEVTPTSVSSSYVIFDNGSSENATWEIHVDASKVVSYYVHFIG